MPASGSFQAEQQQRYTRVAIVIHWLTAVFIITNLVLGHLMEGPPPKLILIVLHIWIGLSVFLLTAFRIVWRVTHPRPAYPAGYTVAERRLAGIAHGGFYVLMIAMPLIGYLLVSANPPNAKWHLTLWGVIPVPFASSLQYMERSSQIVLHDQLVDAHAIGGWIVVGVLALHLAGVVKHQFLDRSNVLARMNPFGRRNAR